MRKSFLVVAVLVFGASYLYVDAQNPKARKEQIEASRKALKAKADKSAVKEAKRMAKEGWKAIPGSLPLEKQLDKAYQMDYQTDEYGLPMFVYGRAISTGGNFDAAKMQAIELAKLDLAGNIQTEVAALVDNTIGNKQMDQGEAESVTKSIAGGKNYISQSIGRVIPVIEVYRDMENGNKEVSVRIAYNMNMAKAAAKNAIKKDMEERGDSLINQLDRMLGW